MEALINSHMTAPVAWHRPPGYDLRRVLRRDLPDLTRNAARGGINQRFLTAVHIPVNRLSQ